MGFVAGKVYEEVFRMDLELKETFIKKFVTE